MKHELLLSKEINSIEDDLSHLHFNQVQMENAGADRLRAFVYLKGLGPSRYGELIKDLRKSLITGQNLYPSTLADAYSNANQFDINASIESKRQRQPRSTSNQTNDGSKEEVNLLQKEVEHEESDDI